MATSASGTRLNSSNPQNGALSRPFLNHAPKTANAITEAVTTVPQAGRSLADKRLVVERTLSSTCSSVFPRSVQAAAPARPSASTPQPQPNASARSTVSRGGERLAVDQTSCAISVDQGLLNSPSTNFRKLPIQCQGLTGRSSLAPKQLANFGKIQEPELAQAQQSVFVSRKQSVSTSGQQSSLAKLAMSAQVIAATSTPASSTKSSSPNHVGQEKSLVARSEAPDMLMPPPAMLPSGAPTAHALKSLHEFDVVVASTGIRYDSPYTRSIPSTAPGSPRIPPVRQNSGSHTPRVRPHATTLNIPGMTRSRVSPDGKIANRDVAAKLVVIMVGLPARGKSYITKKLQRYLAWQQHNTRIFNVGNRRRLAAGLPSPQPMFGQATNGNSAAAAASMILNGTPAPLVIVDEPPKWDLNGQTPSIEQSAVFFDPHNQTASRLREQVAMNTLDEVLDYLLNQNGAVGILDATNSTIHRRQLLVDKIRQREPKLGILFIESICEDENLLEANMRLKLSGPDYKDKDPVESLRDFKLRVKAYESAYEPLGKYEEDKGFPYIQMIDVGRKVIHHRLKGFLSGGVASYLTTFNLAPRQIWITRHGQSEDNASRKLGGNAPLTERGHQYGRVLYDFITLKRREWLVEQKSKTARSHFPPQPGDNTPPYPEPDSEIDDKNFCVWTSMLQRTVETAEYFDADDDYDVKNWEMLNEMHTGQFEGMTYDEIAEKFPEEYAKRARDKLHYIYPGVGGEGYLQVISRLRDMVREIERITEHVLIISHRTVCRVLMAYFMDLTRDDIAELDVPLGMLYAIEPKPYGIEFHAYLYNEEMQTFDELKDYKPQKTVDRNN